jgi:signal transduction histidine kinase
MDGTHSSWGDTVNFARRAPRSKKALTLPGIERRNWWLWSITLSLIATLGLAVAFFSISAVSDVAKRLQNEASIQVLLTSLLGLIVVFCLYLILKQRELGILRQRLFNENRQTGLLQAHVDMLTNLLEAAAALGLQLDLTTVLDAVVTRATRALNADQCAVLLADGEAGRLSCRAQSGLQDPRLLDGEFDTDLWARLWAAGSDEPLVRGAEAAGPPPSGAWPVSSSVAAPLFMQERFIGVLIASRAAGAEPFSEADARLASLFAALVTSGVERADLYERLDRRARSLEAANRKLQELNEVKEMFLTTASHELKTPLTSIISCADLLAYEDLSEEDRRVFVGKLRSQGKTLLGLIEDLMDLSRLRLGLVRLNIAPANLNDIVATALESAEPTVAVKGLDLGFHPDPDLHEAEVDETKVVQIVLNLVGNATKFTDPGGRIDVSTHGLGEEFEIAVADTGRGIPPEAVERIFEAFTRLEDPYTPKTRGMGVGLHLVKQIVELHGGRVFVESELGKGSTFRCRFPSRFRSPADIPGSAHEEDASRDQGSFAA